MKAYWSDEIIVTAVSKEYYAHSDTQRPGWKVYCRVKDTGRFETFRIRGALAYLYYRLQIQRIKK